MTLLYPNCTEKSCGSLAQPFQILAQPLQIQEAKTSVQERVRNNVARHINKDPAAYRAKARAREQWLSANDPLFRASKRVRNILRLAIDRIKKGLPAGYCFRLGYQSQALREHLESQWEPGWDWSNHGVVWTIDHIHPVSAFLKSGETDPGVIHALSNIRPLAKFDNESKHKYSEPSVPRYPRERETYTGENHPRAKLKAEQVSVIKQRLATEHRCMSKLALEYGVTVNAIVQIRKGTSWKTVN